MGNTCDANTKYALDQEIIENTITNVTYKEETMVCPLLMCPEISVNL